MPLDELGRSTFAENLVKLLVSGNMKPPYVFGLFGRWGTGKTWVAKQMEMQLGSKRYDYPTCWFEAWKYESEDNLLLPLCSAIQRKFNIKVHGIDPTSQSQFEWLLRQGQHKLLEAFPTIFRWLLNSISLSWSPYLLFASGTALAVSWFIPHAPQIGSGLVNAYALLSIFGLFCLSIRLRKKLLHGWSDSLDSARDFFRKFITAALQGYPGKAPLFVFIEDLDRCAPDAALKLLEAIKRIALNSADQSPVVFVLVLDRDALVAAIRHRYGHGYGQSWAEDYLHKIIRNSMELPELSFQGMTQFFMNRNTEFHFGFVQPQLDQLARMCVSGRLHNVRKIETVLQRFHLIDSVYTTRNPRYSDFRYKVLFYLLLKEFRPDIHSRIMINNALLPQFVSAASKSVNNWYNQFSSQEHTLADARDRDLAWLFRGFAVIDTVADEPDANRILRYALMIEGVGIQQ